MTLHELILDKVNQGAIKEVELIVAVMDKAIELDKSVTFTSDDFHAAVYGLVVDYKIYALEYISPHAPEKVKTIYFPAGTVFR
jgi:hypothetical protein